MERNERRFSGFHASKTRKRRRIRIAPYPNRKYAEAFLLKSKALGSQAEDLLRFAMYAEEFISRRKNKEKALEYFRRVKEIDIYSDEIINAINNPSLYAFALIELSGFYRMFDDAEKATECLVKARRLELPDDIRKILEIQTIILSL